MTLRQTLRAALAPESVVFVATLLATLWWFQTRAFLDPGSLWHTVVGERILDRGFMTTDPFTYTHPGRTWIPQQWGAEVVMAGLYRLGGFDAQLLAFAAFVAGLAAWLTLRLRRAGLHGCLAAGFAGAAVVAASFHFYVRPHMATVGLMAYVAAVLVDFDRGRAGAAKVAGLIGVCVVWTNLHGGVLGGVLTLGVAVAGWGAAFLLSEWRGGFAGPVTSWRALVLLVGVVIACALTPFDNPFGMEMVRTWQRIVGSTVLPEVVSEHKPLDLARGPDQVVAGFALAYLALFAGTAPNWRRSFRVTWLLPLVWLVLTVKGIRQGPLFAVTAGVVLADFWPHTAWAALLKKYGDSLAHGGPDARVRWPGVALPAAVVAGVLCLQLAGARVPVVGAGWAGLDPRAVPVDLTGAIHDELARTPNARVWNDCNLGGYLTFFHCGHAIFMDDRFELYGDPWTRAYVDMLFEHPERVEDYADEYGCTHALVGTSPDPGPLPEYLRASPRWELVADGQGAALFRRAGRSPAVRFTAGPASPP